MDGFGAIILLGALGGLYLWNLSRAAGNLNYMPGNVTGFSLSGITPFLTAELIIQNTSNINFTINSLAGNVTVDGTQVGNIADFIPVSVLANSQGVLPLTITLQPLGIVNQVITILSGGTGSKEIVIQGSVNANGIQQAFLLQYKIGL